MPSNPDSRSYLIRFGPYAPPAVRIDDEIQCEIRGLVTVADWSDRGEIMWPRCKTVGRRALIITGDLVRALKSETELAFCRLWNVAPHTAMKWKRALTIPARTPGTDAVSSEKSREAMSGRAALPQTKAGLLRAAKRPKSKKWRSQLSARTKARAIAAGKTINTLDADRLYLMLDMRAQGGTLAEIGEVFGMTRQCVQQTLERTTTRSEQTKEKSYTAPRCPCRQYNAAYAARIGHRCEAG